jgi:hypothetical protein
MAKVIPFVREAAATESPLAKKLRAMSTAHAAFWRDDAMQFEQLRKKHGGAKALELMAAARAIVDEFTLKVGRTDHALAVVVAEQTREKLRAASKQPRPRRKERNAVRDERIRTAGKTAEQIAKTERLSPRQVRRILKPKK